MWFYLIPYNFLILFFSVSKVSHESGTFLITWARKFWNHDALFPEIFALLTLYLGFNYLFFAYIRWKFNSFGHRCDSATKWCWSKLPSFENLLLPLMKFNGANNPNSAKKRITRDWQKYIILTPLTLRSDHVKKVTYSKAPRLRATLPCVLKSQL